MRARKRLRSLREAPAHEVLLLAMSRRGREQAEALSELWRRGYGPRPKRSADLEELIPC